MAKNFHEVPALGFEEAREIVIRTVQSLEKSRATEDIPLQLAHGRVLADPLKADRDYPTVRRSLRDGFAVVSRSLPGVLKIRGEVRAGEAEKAPLSSGEALEIMTGAPVPEGADAVVMIEHTSQLQDEDGRKVKIEQTAAPGQFINERGAEVQSGSILIPEGTKLDASHIATLAMTGHLSVRVLAAPVVAILATGDEIVEVDSKPASHQIRNSNSYMLAALVAAAGGKPVILPVARDRRDALRPLLEEGLNENLLLISGGVSAGKYDLVKPVLRELGAEFHFERVCIQPGQPTAFGVVGHKPVFGLPGNPGSSLVTFELFARPAIELLAGQKHSMLPLLWAKFEARFQHKGGLTRFLPAHLSADGQSLRHIPWQGSSDVPALARANAFLVADHDRQVWETGDSIRVMAKP